MSDKNSVISIRVPDGVLEKVNEFCENSPVKISRSAALVYLITKGLIAEGVMKE